MKNIEFRKAYEAAANELEQLLEQQEKAETRIISLRKTMNALATLISQHEGRGSDFTEYAHAHTRELVDNTLTEDIYRVISAASKPLTTSEIREELKELGDIVVEHSNPLATINAILKRLEEQKKVRETAKEGRRAWVKVQIKRGDWAKVWAKSRDRRAELPNPFGTTLGEMLTDQKKTK